MAASSQYHRGATTAHSHYHALPGNHEHLYVDLTTAWSSSHQGLSRSPAPSALLQRYGPPIHRSPAHYVDYSGPGDYVNHQPQPQSQPQTETSWGAQYSRPVVSLPLSQPVSQPVAHSAAHAVSQPWASGLLDTAYTPRSLSYDQQDGRLPTPHNNPRPIRQYQIASDSQQPVGSAHVYRPQDGQNDPDLTTHLTAPPIAHPPPFSADVPSLAPTLAPVASILNYTTPELQAAPSQVQSQAVVPWGHDSGSIIPATTSQHGFHPTGHHIQSQPTLGTQHMLRGPAWDMNQASGVYEPVPEPTPMWTVEQNAQTLDQTQNGLPEPTLHARNGSRGKRSPPKKNAAKVPAAFVARQKKSKVSKRKGPLDEAGRQKTHRMRKEKLSCLRCRFYKSGCDQGEPCQKCQKAVGNARSFKLECTRGRLEDAMLVRHCNGRSNQEEGEFLGYEWIQNWQLLNMEFIWNLPGTGPIHTRPMRITIGQYRPKRALLDAITHEWSTTEGRVRQIQQPPYAVYDTETLVSEFEQYFLVLQPSVERWIFESVQHDEIAFLTYQEVMRLRSLQPRDSHNLLDLCMKVQCLSIISQGYGTVWSNDIPGILEYDYSKMGRSSYAAYDRNSRDRPLPAAINQQMDVAALKLLKKLEGLCHKEISKRVFMPKIKPWYELYLALYVIFWNMEYIHRSAETYILSKNGTAIESHVNSVVNSQLKKWEYSFQVLIHHWMAILRDFYPFKLARENPEELRDKGHLDPAGFEYVVKVTGIVDRIGGIGQSTAPFVGISSLHNSLSSGWIKALLQAAGI